MSEVPLYLVDESVGDRVGVDLRSEQESPPLVEARLLQGAGFRVQGSGCRVDGSGFWIEGLGFGV